MFDNLFGKKKDASSEAEIINSRTAIKQGNGMETMKMIDLLNLECESNDPLNMIIWSPQAVDHMRAFPAYKAVKILKELQEKYTNTNKVEEKKREFGYYKTNKRLFWDNFDNMWVYMDFMDPPNTVAVLGVYTKQL